MSEDSLLNKISDRNPGEPEFNQAVEEVYSSLKPVLDKEEKYRNDKIFERMTEPDRAFYFRVVWEDDHGNTQVNRGYRVQMNSALGPYKGGLRFHPSVNFSVLKFLAFEQTFKNALTGLPMGGGKGGSDFDPKGKSDSEVRRFCQSFMLELEKHIGHRIDIPAGDIGVGGREIGYLFGTYRKVNNNFTGVLTGKGQDWGGSLIRPEATGYGVVYFAKFMMEHAGKSLEGKRCLVSGSGNVAQFTIEKLIQFGAKPISCSDSGGIIIDEEGIDKEKLEFIKELKNVRRGRIHEYADKYPSATYQETPRGQSSNPLWEVKADCAFPCATQNEINEKDAENMVNNGLMLISEGANMPCTAEALEVILDSSILYSPGKASNAGGVATSGLEMVQNYMGYNWKADEVEQRLQDIMRNIHNNCLRASNAYGFGDNYMAGANIAGFIKVADSMMAQGLY